MDGLGSAWVSRAAILNIGILGPDIRNQRHLLKTLFSWQLNTKTRTFNFEALEDYKIWRMTINVQLPLERI